MWNSLVWSSNIIKDPSLFVNQIQTTRGTYLHPWISIYSQTDYEALRCQIGVRFQFPTPTFGAAVKINSSRFVAKS